MLQNICREMLIHSLSLWDKLLMHNSINKLAIHTGINLSGFLCFLKVLTCIDLVLVLLNSQQTRHKFGTYPLHVQILSQNVLVWPKSYSHLIKQFSDSGTTVFKSKFHIFILLLMDRCSKHSVCSTDITAIWTLKTAWMYEFCHASSLKKFLTCYRVP
jgi:hypothetical protein